MTTGEPSNDVVPIGSCLDLLAVASNDEIDNRYDTLSLTGNVDCTGESLSPMYDDADIDFGTLGFRGTLDGNGYSLSNIDIDGTGLDNVGLFYHLDNASVLDITLSGGVVGEYCVGGIAGTATNSQFTNITSTIGLEGLSEVGGLVGCYDGYDDGLGSFSAIDVTTSINSSEGDTGGVIGDLSLDDESELDLSDITVDSEYVDNNDNRYGGVIGDTNLDDDSILTISDVTVESSYTMPNSSTIGGLAGEIEVEEDASVSIEDITIEGSITADEYVGGLIGEVYSDSGYPENFVINDVHLTNNVTGNYDVGGFVGYIDSAQIIDSSYAGIVTGDVNYAGGLVGEAYNTDILESYTSGEIVAADTYLSSAGGLVGYMSEGSIARSYSTADVSTIDGEYLGGLAGYTYDTTVTDSYARGNVTGLNDVGGLIGVCSSANLNNTYATGVLDGDEPGGLLGEDSDCSVENSFWDTESSLTPLSLGDGTGKTTVQMKAIETFLDTVTEGLDEAWDFESVWGIATTVNNGYPCLQWQDDACDSAELEEETEEEPEESVEDDDTDGITSAVEDSAPNEGDANDDGTPDADQNYVSSFVNPVTSTYTAVEVSDDCSLSSVSAEDETAKTVKDSGYDYSTGLVNFTANCGTPGYTTTVRIFAYGVSPSGLILRKHNPVTNAYFSINDAEITQVVVNGENVVVATYEIADGGVLDTDGQENGVIVDPVGLASLVVSVPNTGFRR